MKHQLLLLAISAAAFSSCTSAYRTGQTPDDVYFSPPRLQDEYVRVEEKEDRYRYDDQYYDDRYLRMKVQNRSQWDYLDDWYLYDRYSSRYNYYYGNYYNPFNSWNYWYNPYCRNTMIIYDAKLYSGQMYTVQPRQFNLYTVQPRQFNLSSYTNTNFSNVNNNNSFINVKPGSLGKPSYNNTNFGTNSNNGFGNTIRQIFNNIGGSGGSSDRSYSPSSSGGSSSGSSGGSSGGGGGGGGVSRPSRGGN